MSTEPTSRLFIGFELLAPSLNMFTVVNFSFVLISIALCLVMLNRFKRVWLRVAFQSAVLVIALFQFPLFLFSGVLEQTVDRYILYAVTIHFYIISTLVWVWKTPGLTANYGIRESVSNERVALVRRAMPVVAVATLFVVFVSLYLSRVSLQCTALYASMVDPALMLIAREISIKFVNASYATFAFSLIVNVVAPVLVVMLGAGVISAVSHRRWVTLTLRAIAFILIILTVLLSGTKGNLLPTFVVCCVSLFLTFRNITPKIFGLVAAVAVFIGLVVSLELVKHRGSVKDAVYPLGQCLSRLGSCKEGKDLVDSLNKRVLSMGVPAHRVEPLQEDWAKYCGAKRPADKPMVSQASLGTEKKPDVSKKPDEPFGDGSVPAVVYNSAMLYLGSIARRIFVVPLQIGAWHFQYSDDVFSPGPRYLPFASFFYGGRVTDMPSRVHRLYSPIYSGGAQDTSGTTPTAYMVSAAAYMGLLGILFSFAFISVLDYVAATVVRHVSAYLGFAIVGLMAVGNVNLMLTDFDSAMLSHGTAFALLLVIGLSIGDRFLVGILERRSRICTSTR